MRFLLDDEQRAFAQSLDAMLSAADVPAAARAWSRGDLGPGRALWARLAEAGVFALAVPAQFDGVGPFPLELAVAFEVLGRHAVPGPLVETVAAAALLTALGEPVLAKAWLPGIAAGTATLSLARLPATPAPPFTSRYALDADSVDAVLVVSDDELRTATAAGPPLASHDPARRLHLPESDAEGLLASGPPVRRAAAHAGRLAALATAAQSLGVGRALLARTVGYVGERRQFGTAIGSFQAVKHRLADVLIALEFAQPLVHAAALSLDARDIAMAKVAAGEAACTAARAALQLHGAIGYTDELDLSLWLRKARPLRDAWGTPSACRALILRAPLP